MFRQGQEVICIRPSREYGLRAHEKYRVEAVYERSSRGEWLWVQGVSAPVNADRFMPAYSEDLPPDVLNECMPTLDPVDEFPGHYYAPAPAPKTLGGPQAKTPVEIAKASAAIANVLVAAEQGLFDAANDNQDMVHLPQHYARFTIEPIRFICDNKLNFFQGNIIKYIMRYDAKNGPEDLRKARRYLDMFIKWVDADPDWWKKEAA